MSIEDALEGLSDERIAAVGEGAVLACLADRVPGGPPPIEGDCSADGMDFEAEVDGLPGPVADTRVALLEAATACDLDAIVELLAAKGPYLGDGGLPEVDRARNLRDRWSRSEERRVPVLADLVTTLSSGWMCGPDLASALDGREGAACAFLSGGSGAVEGTANIVLIGTKGGFIGFGANGGAQAEALTQWAEVVTGDRSADDHATSDEGLPRGWPRAVPPSALIDES